MVLVGRVWTAVATVVRRVSQDGRVGRITCRGGGGDRDEVSAVS